MSHKEISMEIYERITGGYLKSVVGEENFIKVNKIFDEMVIWKAMVDKSNPESWKEFYDKVERRASKEGIFSEVLLFESHLMEDVVFQHLPSKQRNCQCLSSTKKFKDDFLEKKEKIPIEEIASDEIEMIKNRFVMSNGKNTDGKNGKKLSYPLMVEYTQNNAKDFFARKKKPKNALDLKRKPLNKEKSDVLGKMKKVELCENTILKELPKIEMPICENAPIKGAIDKDKLEKTKNVKKVKNNNASKLQLVKYYNDYVMYSDNFRELIKAEFPNLNFPRMKLDDTYQIQVSGSSNAHLKMRFNQANEAWFYTGTSHKKTINLDLLDDYSDTDDNIKQSDDKELKLRKIFNCDFLKRMINDEFKDNLYIEANALVHRHLKFGLQACPYYYDGIKPFFKDMGKNEIRKAKALAYSIAYNFEHSLLYFYLKLMKAEIGVKSFKNAYYDDALLYVDESYNFELGIDVIATALLYQQVWDRCPDKDFFLLYELQCAMATLTPKQFRTLRLALNIIGASRGLLDLANNIFDKKSHEGNWIDLLLYTKIGKNDALRLEKCMKETEMELREQFKVFSRYKFDIINIDSDDSNFDINHMEFGEFTSVRFNRMLHLLRDAAEIVQSEHDIEGFDKFGYETKIYQKFFERFSVYHTLTASALFNIKYEKGL